MSRVWAVGAVIVLAACGGRGSTTVGTTSVPSPSPTVSPATTTTTNPATTTTTLATTTTRATTTTAKPEPRPTPPPPTSPPTSPPPGGGCTNGDVINEGAGLSFFEPSGEEYFVHNNNWNDTAGGNSVITACNYDNWHVVSNIPKHGDNSVQTYPNVHRDYQNRALSTIDSARFAATGSRCAGCIYNIAFDIWIGNEFTHELMIWTDNWNQVPAGNMVGVATIGGQQYQVWQSGSGDGGILTYVSVIPQTSGTMPLAAFFADVRARGWTPTTTWQVDYGVEVVDTNGNPERFTFTDFFIND